MLSMYVCPFIFGAAGTGRFGMFRAFFARVADEERRSFRRLPNETNLYLHKGTTSMLLDSLIGKYSGVNTIPVMLLYMSLTQRHPLQSQQVSSAHLTPVPPP